MPEEFDWSSLQSGSDIRGVTDDGTLTPDRVNAIGAAFVSWLKENPQVGRRPRISVGMDSRLSGPELKAALISGLDAGHVYEHSVSRIWLRRSRHAHGESSSQEPKRNEVLY